MRLNGLDRERLDRLAKARGLTRTGVVRELLAEADAGDVPAAPTRSEALLLLFRQARAGSPSAAAALARELRLGDDPAAPAEPVNVGRVRARDLTAAELRLVE
jgi:hypothetical protein